MAWCPFAPQTTGQEAARLTQQLEPAKSLFRNILRISPSLTRFCRHQLGSKSRKLP